MKHKKIIFTGGGTAGHVTPNLALISALKARGHEIYYIGSKKGIEKKLVEEKKISYYAIATGKLRRYLSIKNFIDPFKILWGSVQAYFIIQRIKPNLIFSKGGFVSFPVVLAGKIAGVKVIVHESDLTPGLANRLSFPFANEIYISFPETQSYIKHKCELTGAPIRQEFFEARKEDGMKFLDFSGRKKILLIMGGGLGSERINQAVRAALPKLTQYFDIVHLTGVGKQNPSLEQVSGYKQYEYLTDDLFKVFAAADVVVSRSGANALNEIITLKKKHVLVPLKQGSRGDQIHNAAYYAKQGSSIVLEEENLTPENLIETLQQDFSYQASKLAKIQSGNAVERIVELLS